jgi:thiol:disulfide interchange protein DsbC
MKIKTAPLLFMTIFLLVVVGTAGAQTPEESLKKNFPQIKADKITPTPISGIFEVITKNGILYYAPQTQNIISGEIYAKDGRSLTQERRLELMRVKEKEIPLEKGMKMGTGAHKVIEFSNPDCSYCRKASQYLAERKDITRYVYFLPFSQQTEGKIKYILCATDKAKAYEEAMTGKLDDQKFAVCENKDIDELVKTHRELAQRLGIDATPFFFIDGQVVQGADIPAIEKLLGAK